MKMNIRSFASLIGLSLLTTAASAQTLSLSPFSTTAQAGDTLTFTLSLNPQGAGSSLFFYDVNIFLNSTYLQFTPASAGVFYTPSAASQNAFPFFENTNNTLHTQGDGGTSSGFSYASGTNSVLRVSYDNANSDASFTSQTLLGTFSVKVLSALPTAGTPLLLGAAYTGEGTTATNGGSELLANYSNEVLQGTNGAQVLPSLSAAPEPSGTLFLLVGAGTVSLLALGHVRRRRLARERSIWNPTMQSRKPRDRRHNAFKR